MNRLFIIFSLIFILGCDIDRFVGSDVDSQKLIESTNVSGTIIGYYTGDSVSSAYISVGSQKTMSRQNGEYALTYLLDVTDMRNKPVLIEVTKEDYYPDILEIVLSPTENEFNFLLKYAAPILIRTVRVPDTSPMGPKHTFQAIIKDYQGYETINRVWVKQFYSNDAGQMDSIFVDLNRVQIVNSTTAYYEKVVYDIGTLGDHDYERYYTMWVEDNEGYRDEETRGYRPVDPDKPIF